jgi:20S proteasome alpha/beta subunit
MTVVVAFNCTDGVVIAADSMITPSVGGLSVGHHHGMKVSVLAGPQLFAFAGDQGQATRFRVMAEGSHGLISQVQHPLDYSIAISQSITQQLQSTGIAMQMINANTILAFDKAGVHHCCVFEGPLQPRFLDADHFYVALGSGKLSADPFLRFLVDVFCEGNKQPSTQQGVFLATWAVQHVIDTNPGGVAAPIRVATFEYGADGAASARNLLDDEISEHQQAIESAASALRSWRDQLQSGKAAKDAPDQPELALA